MVHPLVNQLRFARREFVRGLGEVSEEDAQQRMGQMNCISWIVGHLAWQEQRYWLQRAQGMILLPEINELAAYGKPACTPDANEMWSAWQQITKAADEWLENLDGERMQAPLSEGLSSAGTFMLRNIYHYWYHLGEGMAIRQMLGHTRLPDFVGDIDTQAPYTTGETVPVKDQLDKPGFLERVRSARSRLDDLVAVIGETQMLESGMSGEWSVKDILAHITWHERQMLGVLQARALVGSPLWELPLDERNHAIYQEVKDIPVDQVLEESRQTYLQLWDALQKLSEEDLFETGRFDQMPPDWLVADLLADNTYLHYLDHLSVLQTWWAEQKNP